MTACPAADQLLNLLDDALPADTQRTLQTHLESCPVCQQALERLAAAGPSWDRAARHLGGCDDLAGPALADVVAKLQHSGLAPITPTGVETQAALPGGGVDDLTFLDPPEKPGQLGRLAHYEILEVVGRGGMGVVFKAFDRQLGRFVAVKVLRPQYAANRAARVRFGREAKAAAGVSHDNVVPVYSVDTQEISYLVMPLIVGQSLEDRIQCEGALTLPEILRIGTEIASGLAAAHARGLVHRDIKPANILLEGAARRVKITDFGLARAIDDVSVTQAGVITGTPMFMSPEQTRGDGNIDARSDLFSLGSVLYMMATGRPPFTAAGTHAVIHRVIRDTPQSMREINPAIPAWFEAIVAKLQAKEPADRFQSAQAVAELLGQHLAHLQEPQRVPLPARVAAPTSDRRVHLLEAADTERWLVQRGVMLVGVALLLAGIPMLLLVQTRWTAVPCVLAGAVSLVAIAYLRQRFEVHYRGHTLRVVNSCYRGEALFIDDVMVARGGLGPRTELRGVIRSGDGAGDEVVVHCETRLLSFRCWIRVERQAVRVERSAPAVPRRARSPWAWAAVLIAGIVGVTGCGAGLLFCGAPIGLALFGMLMLPPPPPLPGPAAPNGIMKTIEGWGEVIDPRLDCRFERTAGRLTLTVPGGWPHELSIVPGSNLDAPRVLQWVVGDFDAQLKVAEFARAKFKPAANGAIRRVAAGLVVWIDAHNFLCLERASDGEIGGGAFSTARWYIGAQEQRLLRPLPNDKTYLRIERRRQTLHLLTGVNGRDWESLKKVETLPLAERVQVGVYAVSARTPEFTAAFEEFLLLPLPKKNGP
jgi:serine/threonine-protein kinase